MSDEFAFCAVGCEYIVNRKWHSLTCPREPKVQPKRVKVAGPMEEGIDDNGWPYAGQEVHTLLLWPGGSVTWEES